MDGSALPGEWRLSLLAHGALVAVLAFIVWANPFRAPRKEITPIRVIEKTLVAPAEAPPVLEVAPKKPKDAPPPARKAPPAFGLNKNTLLADGNTGVAIKEGNTVAKPVDQIPAADALPVPVEEFLISSMPRLRSEVRVAYPAEAKARKIEGPVVLEILIDEKGVVREVRLLEGPGAGLNEAAVEAVRGFRFDPALIDGKPVAVRIRYTYRFVLRNE